MYNMQADIFFNLCIVWFVYFLRMVVKSLTTSSVRERLRKIYKAYGIQLIMFTSWVCLRSGYSKSVSEKFVFSLVKS